MADLKETDLLLVNRDGVDYNATVNSLAKDINISVEGQGIDEAPKDGRQYLRRGDNTSWVAYDATALKGDKGEKGDRGDSIEISGSIDPDNPPAGSEGDALIDSSGNIWIHDGSNWVNSGPVKGPQGDPGPAGRDGKDGSPGLQGTPGPQGPAGESVEIVAGSHPDALPDSPDPGDAVIDSSTGNLVVWNGGEWVDVGPAVQGPAGIQGPPGKPGSDGVDGRDGGQGPQGDVGPAGKDAASIEINGHYDPENPGAGSEGDAHIDASGNIWIWNGGDWVNSGPVQGPAGPTGPTGPQGQQGLQGVPGEAATLDLNIVAPKPDGSYPDSPDPGDTVIDANGNLIVWDGNTWSPIGAVQGPAGPQGPAGKDGADGVGGGGSSGPAAWNDITGKPSEFPPAAHEHGEYAKLSDGEQSITAKEFIGDGSKLTGLPTASIDEVLSEQDNVVIGPKNLRFVWDENEEYPEIKDPDDLDKDAILNTETTGASYNAYSSTVSYIDRDSHVRSSFRNHQALYMGRYDTNADENLFELLCDISGFYYFDKAYDIEFQVDHYKLIYDAEYACFKIDNNESEPTLSYTSYSGNDVKVEIDGSVTAKAFIGDGSKLTNVALPDFRTLTALS